MKIAKGKARAAMAPIPGFKNQCKMPPPTDDTSDHLTDEEIALEAS